VTDGDTIRIEGERVRLVGFNAPETFKAACAKERELGDDATRRLKTLLANEPADFAKVPCACPPGTEGTDLCNYGRRCGILRAAGRDVGAILISEGLAVPYQCGATSCPPAPRPWCN
jgi:endonuclease YncB( thermonuclease family)